MTDLWTEASRDVEADTLDRHLTTARVASAAVWPFLAAATSPLDYTNRKALVADRIDRIASAAAGGDPALFGVVRAALDDNFDADFTVLHADRVAALQIQDEERERVEQIRRQAERETLRQILAVGEDPKMLGADCNYCGHRLVKMVTGDWNDPYASDGGRACPSSPSGKHEPDRHEAAKVAITLGDMEDKPYQATCPNPDCSEHGISFVHDDLAGDNSNDDATAECPECDTPLVFEGDGKTSARKPFKRRANLSKQAGHEIYVTKKPPCDVCRHQGTSSDAEYDARLPGLGGSWGNVCQRHFDAHGPGQTGTGHAQRYVVKGSTAAAKTAADSTTCADCGNPITKKTDPTGQRGEAWAETHDGGSAWSKDGSDSHDWDFQCGMSDDAQHHPKSTTATRKTAATMISVRDEYDDALTIWSGGFASDYEGSAVPLPDKSGYTVSPEYGEPFTVTCPLRNDSTWHLTDDAIQRAWTAHEGTTASLSPEVARELRRRAAMQRQAEFPPKKDGNPFGGGHDDPTKPKDDPAAGGSWKCPQCGSTNAFTQGGIELADALKQKQPIQCGDCKAIDQTGGQPAADPTQQQQAPHPAATPPGHTGRRITDWTIPAVPPGGAVVVAVGGGGGGGASTVQPAVSVTAGGANPYAGDANPYTQPGTPDDQMDGPQPVPVTDSAPPESTRPRVMPSDPTPPPVTPVAPVLPPVANPADSAAGGSTPPPPAPKKAAGLGFASAAFDKTAGKD